MSSSETAAIELRDRVAFDVLLQFAQKRESIPWMQFIANVYSSTDFVLPTTCRIAVTGLRVSLPENAFEQCRNLTIIDAKATVGALSS